MEAGFEWNKNMFCFLLKKRKNTKKRKNLKKQNKTKQNKKAIEKHLIELKMMRIIFIIINKMKNILKIHQAKHNNIFPKQPMLHLNLFIFVLQ